MCIYTPYPPEDKDIQGGLSGSRSVAVSSVPGGVLREKTTKTPKPRVVGGNYDILITQIIQNLDY